MNELVAKLDIDSLLDLECAIASSPVEPTMLSSRKPSGQIFGADLGSSLVSFASMNADYAVKGVLSETALSIGFVLETDSTQVWSKELAPGTLFVLPANFEHTAVHQGNLKYAILTVDPRQLRNLAQFEGIDFDLNLLECHGFYDVGRKWAEFSTNFALGVCRSIADIDLLLKSSSASTSTALKQGLVDDLLRLFLHSLVQSNTAVLETDTASLQASNLFRETQNYIVNTRTTLPTVEEIAQHLGVSRRTIYRAFKSQVGMAPYKFLRFFRLSRVYIGLKAATRQETMVSSVASSWGFGDLGRFAADYRRVFGELPSETLSRHSDA